MSFSSVLSQMYKVTEPVVIRLGFSQLNPQFGVRFNGGDMDRLPSACKSQNEEQVVDVLINRSCLFQSSEIARLYCTFRINFRASLFSNLIMPD